MTPTECTCDEPTEKIETGFVAFGEVTVALDLVLRTLPGDVIDQGGRVPFYGSGPRAFEDVTAFVDGAFSI